jgi:hypothetical protein
VGCGSDRFFVFFRLKKGYKKARPYKEQARQSSSMKFLREVDSENAQILSKPKTPQSIRVGLRRIGD